MEVGELKMTKRLAVLAVVLCIVLIITAGVILMKNDFLNKVPETETPEEVQPEPTMNPEDDAKFYNAESLLILANKKHKLPNQYEPADLTEPDVRIRLDGIRVREVMVNDLTAMFDAAEEEEIYLVLGSGYRSDEEQQSIYDEYVERLGQENADQISSKAGYSEHQTGLAIDIYNDDPTYDLSDEFVNTDAGKWLAEHAHEYGFILRYPQGAEEITGFAYEPWHYRYVGKEEAEKIHASGKCFEEYYGLKGGDYE